MTQLRSADLQLFLTTAEAAIRHGAVAGSPVSAAADRIFAALQVPAPPDERPAATRLPVCDHLAAALDNVGPRPAQTRALADAFAAIESHLAWKVRPGAEAHGETFLNGHANAAIVGPEGLEIRGDVRIGVSLMAPQTRYPDHRHPPEEIYVVLSDGQWRQASESWHAPGIGGLVYNPPNIVHAMRSAEQPLFALWFLWTGQDAG